MIQKIYKQLLLSLFICIPALFLSIDTFAQGEQSTIQFSGIIVEGDSAFGIPGVHVYLKDKGRGTTTNDYGFFSIPTIVGDTVIVSAVGYEKQEIVIPKRDDLGFTVMINLKQDTTLLPMLEVFPYPTKELFEEAFLALGDTKDERIKNMEQNLSQEKLRYMSSTLGMDASSNYRYYSTNMSDRMATQYFVQPANPLLNPFAWAELIQSIKDGDFKKK